MASRTSRDVLVRGLRILGRAIRAEPRRFAVAAAGSALFGVLTICSAYAVGAVIGHVVLPAFETGGRADRAALALGAGTLVTLSLLKIVSIFGRRLGAGYMQYALQARYRRQVTRRYLQLPVAWHRRHPTGVLLSNANSDVEALWYPIAPMPFALGTVLLIFGAVGVLFATDWVLALIGLALFPALFVLNVVYSRRMAPRQMRAQQLRGEVSAIAHESFDGALVVKTMGREAAETARFAARAGELRDALISIGRLRGYFEPMMDTLPGLGTLSALLVGSWRLSQGAVTVTEMVSVCYLFTVMAMPVRAIGWVLAELPRSVAGWERVQRVLTATGDMPYGEQELARPAAAPVPTGRRSAGVEAAAGGNGSSAAGAGTRPPMLRFDQVGFGYAPEQPVLQDVSFTVPTGRTVALVGRTGSGKSTIAALAARLMDVDSGVVSLGGVDVRELTAASLAANLALVPQIPFVFDDSVRGNVSLGRPGLLDDSVWQALRLAQADGFVARLPDGLDAELGERGTTLSGGQRQRLTLARALAGGPRLLVLDDATSAVDPRVEAAILAALRSSTQQDVQPGTRSDVPPGSTRPDVLPGTRSDVLRGGARPDVLCGSDEPDGCEPLQEPAAGPTSILVVAYRRATIALADEVVYLEHGRVIAHGPHLELLATVPGYADLVTAYERAEAERQRERSYQQAYQETEVSA